MKKNVKVIILGGGISGLGAALKLSRHQVPTEIVEMETIAGGLARSEKYGPYVLDLGPHSFFTEKEDIFKVVMGLFKPEMPLKKRKVELFFNDRFIDYPLTAKSVLFQMGMETSIKSVLSFAKSYVKSRKAENDGEPENIGEWAIENFGLHLWKIFFKPYTEQFWKLPSEKLSSRVIPSSAKMNFIKTIKHLMFKPYLFLTKKEPGEMTLIEREGLPTYYPVNGFGEIPEKIKREVEKGDSRFHLGWEMKRVRKLEDGNFRVTIGKDGEKKELSGNCLVSTIPITKLVSALTPAPPEPIRRHSAELQYLSMIVLYLFTQKTNVLKGQYTYFLHRPYNRVSEMNKFSESLSPAGYNIVSIEMTCHFNDAAWNASADAIYEQCILYLEKDGVISGKEVEDYHIIKSKNVYPIYRCSYEKHLLAVTDFVESIGNVVTIGRQGQFYYGDIDQMIEMSFKAAERIIHEVHR